MVMVTLVLVAMGGLSLSVLAITNSSNQALREKRERTSAMYVAEAAISQSIFDLQNGGTGAVGSVDAPASYEQSDMWVDVTDMGGGGKSLVATGMDKGVGYRIEVLVDQETSTNFIWAAFGDVGMTMDSNAHVDSYDSSLGVYEDQEVNGSGNDTYALENGNVGSNQGREHQLEHVDPWRRDSWSGRDSDDFRQHFRLDYAFITGGSARSAGYPSVPFLGELRRIGNHNFGFR